MRRRGGWKGRERREGGEEMGGMARRGRRKDRSSTSEFDDQSGREKGEGGKQRTGKKEHD
jgi:hypothetical protein